MSRIEWDSFTREDMNGQRKGIDYEVMETPEGQLMLEELRMAIKDYQLYVKGGKKALEAGQYHNSQKAGKYILNVYWWLFVEGVDENDRYYSELPFERVCESLGFDAGTVRRSIKSMAADDIVKTNQIHRRTNRIKDNDVANRARSNPISEGEDKQNACRTIAGEIEPTDKGVCLRGSEEDS